MRIFITGASGLLGGLIADRLRARGDEVVALSRRPGQPRPGLTWVAGDVVEPGPWQDQVEGADAVVHLAGEPLDARRWSARQKERLRESRVAGTANVVAAMARSRTRPPLLLAASAAGIYGARGEEELDERAPPGTGFLAEICQAWEGEARRAGEAGVRTVCLRLGVVLSGRGGALPRMRTAFTFFAGGPLGDRRAWFPWIHEDDVAGLALHALATPSLSGPVNAVAPGIVRMGDFARAIGQALRRPSWAPVPEVALRLLVGELGASINPGMKVIPRAALAAGYRFQHPALDTALPTALARG